MGVLVIRACFFPQIFVQKKPSFLERKCYSKSTLRLKGKNNASQFVAKAASIGGSTADFSESLTGEYKRTQKKRRTIAGVDQETLLDPSSLADPDSLFCEFKAIQIHHKISHHHSSDEIEEIQENKKIALPMILLHGFGASIFSWTKVMTPLAGLTGSKVLAFDRPAFGLTSRVRKLMDDLSRNPYSMAFSVLATLSFIDMLGSNKAILIGHSAGCLVAVSTYLDAPERIAALILIAPAIIPPILAKNNKANLDPDPVSRPDNPFARAWRAFLKLCMKVAGLVASMLGKMRDMVAFVYTKVLSSILRSSLAIMLVRMIIDKFGVTAIKNAWYDPNQVNDHVLQGYTKPLRVKDWEIGLLEYTISMLTNSSSKPSPSSRLSQISCPVLVVTGDTDRLVPAWNAKRVSEAIPGSKFVVIENCGHLPHEEKPEEFLSIVRDFLRNVFGNQNA